MGRLGKLLLVKVKGFWKSDFLDFRAPHLSVRRCLLPPAFPVSFMGFRFIRQTARVTRV